MLDITKLKLNDILVYKDHPDRGECSFIKIAKDKDNNKDYIWFVNEYDEVMCVTVELACNLFEMKCVPRTETFDANKLVIGKTYYQLMSNGLTEPILFQSYDVDFCDSRRVQFVDANGAPCSCSESVAIATFMQYNIDTGTYEYLFENPKSPRLKWALVSRLGLHSVLFNTFEDAESHVKDNGLQFDVVPIEIPD